MTITTTPLTRAAGVAAVVGFKMSREDLIC